MSEPHRQSTFPAGKYTVTMSWDGELHAVWSPPIPQEGTPIEERKTVFREYRKGRDAFLRTLGLKILVVEV